MTYINQVPAAERTLQLLEALAAAPDGLTPGDLLTQLDLTRSTLFALLNTLKHKEYVVQEDRRGPYRLGPAMWRLLPAQQDHLTSLTEAFSAELAAQRWPDTAVLIWLDGDQTVQLAQHPGQAIVRAMPAPGSRQPAHAHAAGHILLAGQPPDQRRHLPLDTAVTNHIIQQGIAHSQTADLVELAAPICADGIQPTAALARLIPAHRWPPAEQTAVTDTTTHQLRQTAARLSYCLGAPVYQPYGWASSDTLGPDSPLSQAEMHQFLHGPWGAKLACIRQDGAPHVVPLWYEWDGRSFWVVASPGAYWKQYVRESSRISLTIDEPWPPLRRAHIVGQAQLAAAEAIPGGITGLRQRLAVRYLGQGADCRPEFQNAHGWQAFCITPEKISGRKGLGS
jgi:DNA-binding IclR family transcriptional regulator